MDTGICYIKSEFLLPDKPRSEKLKEPPTGKDGFVKQDLPQEGSVKQDLPEDGTTQKRPLPDDGANNGNAAKLQKGREGKKKERRRGQNKDRPVFKEIRGSNLCNAFFNGPDGGECTHLNCIFMHDVQAYLDAKPKDISDFCYIYSTKGFCQRGLTCRFAKAHLDENFNNLKQDFYDPDAKATTCNGIQSELQVALRKRDYNFDEATTAVRDFEKQREERLKAAKDSVENENAEKIGCVVDDEDEAKRKPDFRNKLILSPLTTVGNLPFRRICKEFGADITCGEMACTIPLVKGLTQEWALTKRHESEDIFGVQICGNSSKIIAQAVQLIKENSSVDYVDLNIGCPIELIYQQGGGSALIRRQNILEVITRSCSRILGDIPFTVKTRTGIYANKSVAHEMVPNLEEWGAKAITIHGRSREQRYTKNSNWEYIEKCAAAAKNIPIIGNGDILSYEDYNERKAAAPHVSSVMIGRGALIKPWIFKEIKEQKTWDPSSAERFEMLKKYVNYGLEHWGSDTKGVENTRRFLLEWQSFLFRYVPSNLLEHPPQKINQRPQKYRGRDELETLMSSNYCADWIKISEMLLGPVPDGFTFLPKHKANSYS